MRSITTNFLFKTSQWSAQPFNLLVFNFAEPVYISDRDVSITSGDTYTGLVKDWGFIDTGISAESMTPGVSEISDFQVTVINSESPRFSDNFTDADPLENVEVCLYQFFGADYFGPLDDTDKLLLFKGYIFGQPKWNLYECTVTVRGVWHKYNKKIGADLLVNETDYPGADPDEMGKMLPLVWGKCDKVPFRAVDAGGLTTLAKTLDTTETAILVTDPDRLPASGTVQIDQEQITYTGKSANNLTGCARGANGTDPVEHELGAKVAEVQSEYIYAAGCVMNSIGNVYVRSDNKDVLIPTSYYTVYTGQTGDSHASYPGKAVIAFTTFPALYVKIELQVDDSTLVVDDSALDVDDSTLDIVDTINISESGHAHESAISEVVAVFKFESYEVTRGAPSFPECLCDNDLSTFAGLSGSTDIIKIKKAYYTDFNGTPTHYRICAKTGEFSTNSSIAVALGGNHLNMGKSSEYNVVKTSWLAVDSLTNSWADWNAITATISSNASTYPTEAKIAEVWAEIKYAPSDTSSDSSGATKGGGVTKEGGVTIVRGVTLDGTVDLVGNSIADTKIGGQVLVDCEGFKDTAGTFTGTSGALIERPDHVFKHILLSFCGFPSGDMDTATLTASGTYFNTNNYKFGFCLSHPVLAEELLLSLAAQCRSRFFVTAYGAAKLIVREMDKASVRNLDENEIKEDSVYVTRTPTETTFNYFNVYWDKDNGNTSNGPEAYKSNKLITASDSIALYGQRDFQGSDSFFCFYAVTSQAMAEHVAGFYRDWHAFGRKMPACAVFLDNIEIEPGDVIDITHRLDNMSGFKVEVVKILHNLGSAQKGVIDHIELVCVENGTKN